MYRKLDVIKYSYDLSDDDVRVIEVIKQEVSAIKKDYDEIINAHRTGSFALYKSSEGAIKRNGIE